MPKFNVLGIETSCDDTCAAVFCNNKVVSNVSFSQEKIHNEYGGIVPELASRQHVEKIDLVIEEALKKANIEPKDLSVIAFTETPGLAGSLFVGKIAAKTMSLALRIPLIRVNHLHAHIFSAAIGKDFYYPLIALVVSGGHTEFYYCEENLSFLKIGTTYDDALGECYDKVARILGLDYPGGPIIDELAKKGKPIYKVPTPKVFRDTTLNFSFSGIKTWIFNFVRNNKNINIPDMCASFQNVVINLIMKKIELILKEYKVEQFVLAGGVSANSELRRRVQTEIKNVEILLPSLKYTTDNAAMVARLGIEIYNETKQEKLWETKTIII